VSRGVTQRLFGGPYPFAPLLRRSGSGKLISYKKKSIYFALASEELLSVAVASRSSRQEPTTIYRSGNEQLRAILLSLRPP
jgi:hypothetical protein